NIYKNADDHTILQQVIYNDQLTQHLTRDDNNIPDSWNQLMENKVKNSEPTNSGFISYKKCHFLNLQASNILTHYEIYHQVANRNFEDYCSKIERQIHTKYNIQEHNYKVDDIVKIQIAKIDRGSVLERVFPAKEVLPLGLKEFSELNNPNLYDY
ncbi:17267_t:CDS:2, partial [Racocetra persica]